MKKENVIVGLLTSRKAVVVIFVVLASFGALYLGKAAWPDVESLLKWLLGAWLVGQGLEDGAGKLGASRIEVAKINSIPPPAMGRDK